MYRALDAALAAVEAAPPLARAAVLITAALVGALGFALLSVAYERAAYAGYAFLERLGLIDRLIPGITPTATDYQKETFRAFVFSLWPALLLIFYNLRPLLACAAPDWNPLTVLAGVWVLSILHDPWFWAVHATLHRFKPLYRKIHHQHHDHPWGDMSLHQTADMHFVEAFALTMGFYAACLVLALNLWGSWNPVLFYAYIAVEANMNMGGHCGYHMPAWLQLLVTAGVGNTPWSASSLTHYIHHLDPSKNRALYFTWVDKLAGTYRASHPKIKPIADPVEYNRRPLRLAAKLIAARWGA